MKNCQIAFKSLSLGKHNFNFEITDYFFEQYPDSEIQKGNVKFDVEINVDPGLLVLKISLNGKVIVQCDRCLDYFDLAISYSTELFVEIGENNSDLSDVDNKMILSHKETKLNLSKHFYDYIYLSLPYQKIHPDNEKGQSYCNQEMIKKLEDYTSVKETGTTDPRWEKLKNLYN